MTRCQADRSQRSMRPRAHGMLMPFTFPSDHFSTWLPSCLWPIPARRHRQDARHSREIRDLGRAMRSLRVRCHGRNSQSRRPRPVRPDHRRDRDIPRSTASNGRSIAAESPRRARHLVNRPNSASTGRAVEFNLAESRAPSTSARTTWKLAAPWPRTRSN